MDSFFAKIPKYPTMVDYMEGTNSQPWLSIGSQTWLGTGIYPIANHGWPLASSLLQNMVGHRYAPFSKRLIGILAPTL